MHQPLLGVLGSVLLLGLVTAAPADAAAASGPAEILTPPPPATPRINGARVYGERPGRPFLFTVPATGDEPITYAAEGLPPGLSLEEHTGRITGTVTTPGSFKVTLTATNAKGTDRKPLRIEIGDRIALTPPMGWNSWNCFAESVDQDKVAAAAKAMIDKGLIRHGWTYINIDDTWQGTRSPEGGHPLRGNEKFPDLKKLTDDLHAMGLKAGIYSTPWLTSYAGHCGGSSDSPDGMFVPTKNDSNGNPGWHEGKVHFETADAKQFAGWGFDYLKYDWNPITPGQTKEMADALLASGRDLVYSLSNSAPFAGAADWAQLSNSWRTTGDIRDTWHSMSGNGFTQNKWAPFAGPGHWNDPDMLVVGYVGWGPNLHNTRLTPDEQLTHITLWSLLASPLLIGCDMTKLDDFTLGLLTNDEVLAVDQDELGKQATRIAEDLSKGTEVWARPLADGTMAVGLFNRGTWEVIPPRDHEWDPLPKNPLFKLRNRSTNESTDYPDEPTAMAELARRVTSVEVTVRLDDLHLSGQQPFRDLWRQRDYPPADQQIIMPVPFHGAAMLKVGTPKMGS